MESVEKSGLEILARYEPSGIAAERFLDLLCKKIAEDLHAEFLHLMSAKEGENESRTD